MTAQSAPVPATIPRRRRSASGKKFEAHGLRFMAYSLQLKTCFSPRPADG